MNAKCLLILKWVYLLLCLPLVAASHNFIGLIFWIAYRYQYHYYESTQERQIGLLYMSYLSMTDVCASFAVPLVIAWCNELHSNMVWVACSAYLAVLGVDMQSHLFLTSIMREANASLSKAKKKKPTISSGITVAMTKTSRFLLSGMMIILPGYFLSICAILTLGHMINAYQRIRWAKRDVPLLEKIIY
jgi:hypothetical protein